MAAASEGKYGVVTAEKKEFHPGEPVFLLRGTDAHAPTAVLIYAELCRQAGCSTDHVQAARIHARRLLVWQEANPSLVKVPD